MKHTPGPWTLKRSGTIAQKETGDVIATCGYRVEVGSNEDDDNAVAGSVEWSGDTLAVAVEDAEAALLGLRSEPAPG